MSDKYWIISYRIEMQSDVHVGAGISLLGGNLHGMRKDEDGFAYIPSTQARGLIRLGGSRLKEWQPNLNSVFRRNFRGKAFAGSGLWSFTSARYPLSVVAGADPKSMDISTEQSHIKREEDIAENLFSYEKAGGFEKEWRRWHGKIYSVEPACVQDVAFMIFAMRAEDRIGLRRSRGYGNVKWQVDKIENFDPGQPREIEDKGLEDWFSLLFETEASE